MCRVDDFGHQNFTPTADFELISTHLRLHTSLKSRSPVRLGVYVCGWEPEPINEMEFHIADRVFGPPGLLPQKLFNFIKVARKKK